MACWHIAWHRSCLCPTSTQPGSAPARGQAGNSMDKATLFLAEERRAIGLGIAWRCSPSGPKDWPWSVLFKCTDTFISSRDFFCSDTALVHSRKSFIEDKNLRFSQVALPVYSWVGWGEVLGNVIASSSISPWHNAALCTTWKDAFTVLFFLR